MILTYNINLESTRDNPLFEQINSQIALFMHRVNARLNRPILQLKVIVMQWSFRVRRAKTVNRRTTRVTVNSIGTMSFLVSPYDNPLDLSNKEDRKLFNDACNELEKDDMFDCKLINSSNFLNLIGKEF